MKTSVASSPRSCSAERSTAPSRRARFGSVALRADGDGHRHRPAAARQLDAAGSGALADQLHVRARAGREALRADVQRLEQVRLAGAVRPGDEDEPRLERELEPGVRPEVAERDLGDDQPASLIGMIRYQNESSSADVMRPGRSGLISFRRTVSLRTASTPSARNSALKPISSGSPV